MQGSATSGGSPFHAIPAPEWVAENRSAFAVADSDPVTDGHTLIVPRRMIRSWSEAVPEEQADLLALVSAVKELLDQRISPDGYTIGIDDGPAAGQQGGYLHIHLIPRWDGELMSPRGIRDLFAPEDEPPALPVVPAGLEVISPPSTPPH